MTDITDPVVLITLAQTVVLTITMVVFIYQFRAQNEAIRDSSYQKVMDDFTDAIALMVDKPQLAGLLDELGPPEWRESQTTPTTPERSAIFGYMLLNYSLLERVYALYSKKWIDKDTWDQWHRWLKTMAKHPSFQEVHRRSEGTFDKDFQKLVSEAMK